MRCGPEIHRDGAAAETRQDGNTAMLRALPIGLGGPRKVEALEHARRELLISQPDADVRGLPAVCPLVARRTQHRQARLALKQLALLSQNVRAREETAQRNVQRAR